MSEYDFLSRKAVFNRKAAMSQTVATPPRFSGDIPDDCVDFARDPGLAPGVMGDKVDSSLGGLAAYLQIRHL